MRRTWPSTDACYFYGGGADGHAEYTVAWHGYAHTQTRARTQAQAATGDRRGLSGLLVLTRGAAFGAAFRIPVAISHLCGL